MTRSLTSDKLSITTDTSGNPISKAIYEFSVSFEIREKVSKNTYVNVSREKSCFKLRQSCDKEICIIVKQVASDDFPSLFIERCFGVLLSIGKIQKQSDLQLLEMTQGCYLKGSSDFQILASWDPNETRDELTSTSTQLTLACDLGKSFNFYSHCILQVILFFYSYQRNSRAGSICRGMSYKD